MQPAASPPAAVAPSAQVAARGRVVGFAVLLAAGALTLAIHFDLFPPRVQLVLRDWGLHWSAVLATSLLVAIVLGADTGLGAPFAARLAVFGPFTCLALHELGQWLWPARERDAFDSLRDLAMNAVGAGLAWWLLRQGRAVARARQTSLQAARATRLAKARA